jgi:hypothetical protein
MTTVLDLPARPDAPIACDMSTAPDTPDDRLAAYRELFERARTIVVTVPGDAREAVEVLARREAACCPFRNYRVDVDGDAVVWTITAR